jgi:hypothetical protein
MPGRKLQQGSEDEFRCIGKLLKCCQMPVRVCDDCWFGTDQNKPRLVRIAVFNQIEDARIEQFRATVRG